jgi:arylsulfatase
LQNVRSSWKDRYLFTHVGRWKVGDDPEMHKFNRCAVRSERFRFVNNRELFDMEADPGQEINVIEKFPETVQKMRQDYDVWWEEVLPLLVNEKATYEGPAPFIKNYNEQLQTRGIPDWIPPEYSR